MSDAGFTPQLEITQDDRTMGILAHVLQVVGWWIAPLIIFLVKRDSLFVKFHALQALILQLCLMVLWIGGMAVFFGAIFASMPMSGSPPHNAPPPAIMFLFPIFWLLAMGGWVLVLVLAIVYGIKAGRGEWAAYPVIGNLARHFLKM
ncbi:MAG: DUF4870 domain-containing protein [Acidobacteriia bacterium]|nr:DUF4870 domain-containing protein [Terriglobia bacterium]